MKYALARRINDSGIVITGASSGIGKATALGFAGTRGRPGVPRYLSLGQLHAFATRWQ